MGKSTISMAMFNSKLLVSRGEPSHYLLVIRWRCDPESRIRLHLKIGLLTNKTGSIRESFVIYYIGKYIYIHNHIIRFTRIYNGISIRTYNGISIRNYIMVMGTHTHIYIYPGSAIVTFFCSFWDLLVSNMSITIGPSIAPEIAPEIAAMFFAPTRCEIWNKCSLSVILITIYAWMPQTYRVAKNDVAIEDPGIYIIYIIYIYKR